MGILLKAQLNYHMRKIAMILAFFIFSCDDNPPEKHGCLDSEACNYDADATMDLFPDSTCLYEIDCEGVCGGDALDSNNDGICDE